MVNALPKSEFYEIVILSRKEENEMAVYCDEECKMIGPICDFCIHYRDDETNGKFHGEGYCKVKRTRVDACGGCEDEFCCFQVKL